ncbi:MAG: Uma2 family endonuclease [Planctomycetota bacterium]
MTTTLLKPWENALPPIFDGIPVIYEDDEHEDILMGENVGHYAAGGLLFFCLQAHLKRHHPELLVACNLNCYYLDTPKSKKSGRNPYISADAMIVQRNGDNEKPTSYIIGKDGPPPFFVCEILSQLSGTIRDPIEKPEIYAKLGVTEYLLIDELGRFLPQPLLLKKLRPDRTWEDSLDDDGGVTSRLGFRIVHDGELHVLDAATGKPYVRPGDAEDEVESIEREKQAIERKARSIEREKQTVERKARAMERRNEALERSNSEAEAKIAALQEELANLRRQKNDDKQP